MILTHFYVSFNTVNYFVSHNICRSASDFSNNCAQLQWRQWQNGLMWRGAGRCRCAKNDDFYYMIRIYTEKCFHVGAGEREAIP